VSEETPKSPSSQAAETEAEAFDGHAKVERLSGPSAPAEADGPDATDPRIAALTDPWFRPLLDLPFLDPYYNETYLFLVPSDPKSVFVLWEVSEGTRGELTHRFGPDFLEKNHLILRVYDVTGIQFDGYNANSVFEVDDYLNDKVQYWVSVEGARDYIAEIGYRATGTTYFEMVARSNSVRTPRGVPQPDETYAGWGSVHVQPNDVEVPVSADQWRFNQYLYWKQRKRDVPDEKGYWALILHQHLPFVRHPEYSVSLEEQWFFEAVVSVYTQLLDMFWRLERDKVDFRVTLSLTPPLLSMMQDPLLKIRTARHIDECIALAEREVKNAGGRPWQATAQQTLDRFWTAKRVFEAYQGDLTRGYRAFQDLGKIEVITCPATHMILPLFKHFPETVRAQIQTACRQYRRTFGRSPRGIWLAENAWTPGLDEFLAAEGIRWFVLNDLSVLEGDTRPFYGTAGPVITPAGVAGFGIDTDTRAKIWSREGGYPGHVDYKEWYRDLGYDADEDYLPDYWKTANVRRNTGIKYYRITDKNIDSAQKAYYDPARAYETVHEHAGQFVFERGAQANYFLGQHGGHRPCVVSAYDAELYGHWWQEGPDFLESVFRKLAFDQTEVRPVTPGEYLADQPTHQKMVPGAGSWGKGQYFQTWVDDRAHQPNSWVYRHLFRLCGRMADAATRHRDTDDPLLKRALDQAARSLFLAGASDWGFLISTGQAIRYSEVQILTHIDRTKELLRQIEAGEIREEYLALLESVDTIFPFGDMDFRVFCRG
jgi:1,4-alpha-glucan branching enzyme